MSLDNRYRVPTLLLQSLIFGISSISAPDEMHNLSVGFEVIDNALDLDQRQTLIAY